MHQQSIVTELRSGLNVIAFIPWCAVGTVITTCAWQWGDSPLPAWGLTLTTGMGGCLVMQMVAVTLLGIVALTVKSRAGVLALGCFRKFQPRLLVRLLRAASVLFGVAIAATVYWHVTGSVQAQDVAIYSVVIGITLAYIRCIMVRIGCYLHQSSIIT